ncbi:MAG: hypothetical protein P4L31_06045 [Candidatus Babeliales bacterium]|nr:hypothetical protein [Candidatus Babeliales bacterium]
MKKLLCLLLSILFCSQSIFAKVLVITHSCNRPDLIKLQDKTFKKFLKNDYEFVVFNDARKKSIRHEIDAICSQLHIRCIGIPQEVHDRPYLARDLGEDYNNANARCANVVQYSLDVLGFKHDGIVMIIDSDMFLISDFNVEESLENYPIAGVHHSRGHVNYLWNGLVLLNMRKLPNKTEINFNCGRVDGFGTDVGGFLYYYFKKHPEIKSLPIGCLHMNSLICVDCLKNERVGCKHNTQALKSLNFNERAIQLIQSGVHNIEFLFDNAFLHYRGATNWDNKSSDYHAQKTVNLNKFMHDILN